MNRPMGRMPDELGSRKVGPTLVAVGLAATALVGAFLLSRIVSRRRSSGSPYIPPRVTLSRAERDSLEEARETGDIETVVADIDLADRYDRYSG